MCVEDVDKLGLEDLNKVILTVIKNIYEITAKEEVNKLHSVLCNSLTELKTKCSQGLKTTYYGYKYEPLKDNYAFKYYLNNNIVESFVYYDKKENKCYRLTLDNFGTSYFLENYNYSVIN